MKLQKGKLKLSLVEQARQVTRASLGFHMNFRVCNTVVLYSEMLLYALP